MVLLHIIYLNIAKHKTKIFIYLNSLPQDFFFYHLLPSYFTLTEKLFPFTLIPVNCFFSLSVTPNFCLSSYCNTNFMRIKSVLLMSVLLPFHTVRGVLKARILKWFAIPFSRGPHSVRPLHHDPPVLGGPTQHGLVSLS